MIKKTCSKLRLGKDTRIFLIIYLATIIGLLYYNLAYPPINDGVKEYETFLLNLDHDWEYRRTLVNSSLITTWLPAMVARIPGLDAITIFRITPPIFYALMPAFTYLIARRYLAVRYAVVASLVVMTNSHILFFPDIGRVGVSVTFFAGMIWALLHNRLWWAIVFALLVVFSHYGTALIAMGLTLACWTGYLVWKKQLLKQYLIVFCVLVASIGIWHFWISSYSGWVMFTYGIQEDMPWATGDIIGPNWHGDWLSPRDREPAVQNALGIGVDSIPKLIEVLANWTVVGATTLGLWVFLRNKSIENIAKIMALSLWALIVFTVIVPWLSVFYGGMRVFFTALPILALCFPLGVKRVAGWVRVKPLVLCGVALTLFALSTSGVVYQPFGLEKTVPVYWTLENLEGVTP